MSNKNTIEQNVLWQDRKRHLGLPLSFTKYTIDEDRLYIQTGFFKTEVEEVLLYRIMDIKSSRTLGQKIFGVGTITLYSADQSNPTTELINIKNPIKLHRFISDVIEQEKVKRGIAGREMIGAAGVMLGGLDNHIDTDGDGICDIPDMVSFDDYNG